MVEPGENTVEREQRSALVALSFWLCLIVSTGLYAICSLSPRVVQWTELQQRYVDNQVELLAVQDQVKHLDRVVEALETDPEFAGRLARSEFRTAGRGAVGIRLPDGLNYDPRIPRHSERPVVSAMPWYLPLLEGVAHNDDLRLRGLATAAFLTLFAFVFLQDRPLGLLRMPRRLLKRVASRYVIDGASRQPNR